MKSIQFYTFGDPNVLKYEEVAEPPYNDDQILIKTRAAGINRIDCKIREGSSFVSDHLKDLLPSSLGYEFSGEVIAIGKNVSKFSIGNKVLGTTGFPYNPCCYGETVVASSDSVIHKPENIDFTKAATLPLAGLTALQALNLADIKPGDRVFVQAGAGGVGHLAVQLAKLKGATVITTARTNNHSYLNNYGVDLCIDYEIDDFTKVITEPVDVVIDLIGGHVGIQSLNVLSKNGIMVSVPTITAKDVIAAGKKINKTVVGVVVQFNMQELSYLAGLVNIGQLSVDVFKDFPLAEAATAQRLLESGGVKYGKLALVM